MTHVCICRLDHHRLRLWLVAWSTPSHYRNQWWNIDNWTLSNKLYWHLNWNSCIFIQVNAFENIVWKMSSVLSRPQCVKGIDNDNCHKKCMLPWISYFHVPSNMSAVSLFRIRVNISLQWRHNECDGISNHQTHNCLLKSLFRCRSKKTSMLHVTGLCEGNLLVMGEFPTQRASNVEKVSIWWCHHHVPFWQVYLLVGHVTEILCISIMISFGDVHVFTMTWNV